MFLFSGKRQLVKNVTVYCFLSKTIQLINLREMNNIARIWEIFGAKTESAARISRFFYGLNVKLGNFKHFTCVKFPFLLFYRFLWNLYVAC